MANNEAAIVEEAINFLLLYTDRGNERLRKEVKQSGYFGTGVNRKPLFYYIIILATYSPQFKDYYDKIFRPGMTENIKARIRQYLKKEPDRIDAFLFRCRRNEQAIDNLRLRRALLAKYPETPGQITPEQIKRITEYQGMADSGLKSDLFLQTLTMFSQEEEAPVNFRELAEKVNNPRNLTDKQKTQAETILRKLIVKYGEELLDPTRRALLIRDKVISFRDAKIIFNSGLLTHQWQNRPSEELFKETAARLLTDNAVALKRVQRIRQIRFNNALEAKLLPLAAAVNSGRDTLNRTGQELVSTASIALRKSAARFPTAAASLFSGAVGGLIGATSGAGQVGFLAGFGAGATIPLFIKNGGGNFLGKVVESLNNVPATLPQFKPPGLIKKAFFKNPWVIGAGVLSLLLILLPMGLLNNSALQPPFAAEMGPRVGGGGAGTGTGEGSGSCPTQEFITQNRTTTSETCRYLDPPINIFGDLTPEQIQRYKDIYWPEALNTWKRTYGQQEFNKRVDLIVQKSREAGLNPILFLGYWKSESGFADGLGCASGDPSAPTSFSDQVACATGLVANGSRAARCAGRNIPSADKKTACDFIKSQVTAKYCPGVKDASNRCAHPTCAESEKLTIYDTSLFDLTSNDPIKTFDAFAEAYGSRSPNLTIYDCGEVNRNCTSTYNILLSVILETGACTPRQNSNALITCPLAGTRVISCGSFGSDPKFNSGVCRNPNPAQEVASDRGHCGRFYGTCGTERKKHSIDVNAPAGEDVKLPTIEGQTVSWSHYATFGPLSTSEGSGYGHIFNTTYNEHQWAVYLIHTEKALTSPPAGRGYQSGDPVTKIAATPFTHLHVNIGKDATSDNGTGWIDPESLGVCVNI